MTDYASDKSYPFTLAAGLAGVAADRVLSAHFDDEGNLTAAIDYGIAGGMKFRYAADQVKGVESGALSVKHAAAESVEAAEKAEGGIRKAETKKKTKKTK